MTPLILIAVSLIIGGLLIKASETEIHRSPRREERRRGHEESNVHRYYDRPRRHYLTDYEWNNYEPSFYGNEYIDGYRAYYNLRSTINTMIWMAVASVILALAVMYPEAVEVVLGWAR